MPCSHCSRLLALFPAADLAIALTNRGVMERVRPAPLPSSPCADGVPGDLRTLVAVPTLLTSEANALEQIDQLEIHYLANPDDELRFALASDWVDAPAETMPSDEALARRRPRRHRAASTPGTAPRTTADRASSSSIAGASGTKARGPGSDGSASAASCTS